MEVEVILWSCTEDAYIMFMVFLFFCFRNSSLKVQLTLKNIDF